MKTPHQTQETAQISAINDRSMVGQGEPDLFIEIPQMVEGFRAWLTGSFRNTSWFNDLYPTSRLNSRVNKGLIILTKELVVWSICDLKGQ